MRRLAMGFVLAGLLLAGCGGDNGSSAPFTSTPADDGPTGTLAYNVTDRNHIEGPIDYPIHPPVGGNHNPVFVNCQFYSTPVPDENAVHSLEHGAVWIAYAPDTSEADLQTLQGIAAGSADILISQYPGLDSPIVMTAWNRQLKLDSISDPRAQEFLDDYLNGPTAPEVGAGCQGGVG